LNNSIDGLTFLNTLELELFRLEKTLSAQRRDSILLELRVEIDSFNPDRFIFPRDEKTEISLRKSNKFKSNRCAAQGLLKF